LCDEKEQLQAAVDVLIKEESSFSSEIDSLKKAFFQINISLSISTKFSGNVIYVSH